MKYVIGFDFNMSGLMCTLVSENGEILGGKSGGFPTYENGGRTWANPDQWVDASFALINDMLSELGVSADDVVAIGTCGHPVYLACTRKDGSAPKDEFYWLSGLSLNEAGEKLQNTVGREKLISICAKGPEVLGLGPNPNGPLALGTMLLWLRDKAPERLDGVDKVLYGKDYLNYVLTGRAVMDVTDASFTLLFDVEHRCWSGEILDILGIDASLLPDIVESADVIGRVSKEAAARSGLRAGTIVVGGLTNKGSIAITGGAFESGVTVPTVKACNIVAACDKYINDPTGLAHTYCSPVSGKYFVMCDGAGSGNSLVWFLETYHSDIFVNMRGKRGTPLAKVEEFVKQSPPGANGVVFLPYGGGSGAPHPDKEAKACFFGITNETTDADITRAALESTCYEVRMVYEYLESLGIPCTKASYHMWGTAPYHLEMLINSTGRPSLQRKGGGGPMLGGALLALAGCGICADVPAAVNLVCGKAEEIGPGSEDREGYEKSYAIYKALYNALKPVTEIK